METTIYRKVYRGNVNGNGNNVATIWVSRDRDTFYKRTFWRGGVLFGTFKQDCIETTCFDGVSWKTTLQDAARASKTRDNAAIDTLFYIALGDASTMEALNGMGVGADVLADYENKNGALV